MSDVVKLSHGRRSGLRTHFNLDAAIAAAGAGEPEPDRLEFEKRFPYVALSDDAIFINENPADMELTAAHIDDMCMHFYEVMRYVPVMPLITGWRELMQRITMADVCAEIRASTRSDWKRKPSYYTALVMEFYGRTGTVIGLLSM